MKKITLELVDIERICWTPFRHFLDIGEMVVNSYQVEYLFGHYIGKYSFNLKKKILWLNVEDVGKILSLSY